jgi:hypothetical protein
MLAYLEGLLIPRLHDVTRTGVPGVYERGESRVVRDQLRERIWIGEQLTALQAAERRESRAVLVLS